MAVRIDFEMQKGYYFHCLVVVKCTSLKQWHSIDVNMFVHVMDLVHVHCTRALFTVQLGPQTNCAKWYSYVPSHVFNAN